MVDTLNAIGWRGPLDEVVRYWREDPDRVENLLWYAQRKGWGAGLLRNALRSGEWPPELKPGSRAALEGWRKAAEQLEPEPEPLQPPSGPLRSPTEIPAEVRRWWHFAREQLFREMPKGAYDAHVQPARLWGFEDNGQGARVTIAAPTAFSRDWLTARLTKILEHKLTGFAGRPVAVAFIAQEDADV